MTESTMNSLVRGMVAGAIGTAAMTVSERLEMSLSGRAASQVPGQVGAHLLPGTILIQHRMWPGSTTRCIGRTASPWGAYARHWTQPACAAQPPPPPTSLWYGAAMRLCTGRSVSLRRRGTGPQTSSPPTLLHKGVYAAVTGAVYDALSPTPRTVPAPTLA
jgi:hypothetical protein